MTKHHEHSDNCIHTLEYRNKQLFDALRKIKTLSRPGQEIGITDAVSLILEIYTVSREALGDAQ